MFELIYSSVASPNLIHDDILNILAEAREFNLNNNISGCLLFHKNEFIQILEGDKKVVQELFEKILQDKRHQHVTLLTEEVTSERVFAKWSMAYHKVEQNDTINVEKMLFVNNLLALSDLITKPTQSTRLFWYMVKQLLRE